MCSHHPNVIANTIICLMYFQYYNTIHYFYLYFILMPAPLLSSQPFMSFIQLLRLTKDMFAPKYCFFFHRIRPSYSLIFSSCHLGHIVMHPSYINNMRSSLYFYRESDTIVMHSPSCTSPLIHIPAFISGIILGISPRNSHARFPPCALGYDLLRPRIYAEPRRCLSSSSFLFSVSGSSQKYTQ